MLLKTNTVQYLRAIENEIIDSIDLSGYIDIDQDELTDRQKVEYMLSILEDEGRWNMGRFPNKQAWLADFLMGLPSVINLPFANWDILNFAAKLHGLREIPEAKQDVILENYWNHMAFHILKLGDKVKKQAKRDKLRGK